MSKSIVVKFEDCQVKVIDGNQVCYFNEVIKASKNRIWLSNGALTCSFDTRCIMVPNLDGIDLADWINTQLLECANSDGGDSQEPTGKTLVQVVTGYHVDDPKKPVKLFLFTNPECVTTDLEGTNVVDINDYIMGNTPGYGRELPKNSSPLIPFSLCGPFTGTLADILPELANDADFETAGTEEVPTGLIRLQIYQAPKGTTCKGQPVTAGGVTIGDRSLDDAEGWCKKKDYEDKDCDSYSEGIDLTTPLVIPEGAAILGEGIGICLDADDNDSAVQ